MSGRLAIVVSRPAAVTSPAPDPAGARILTTKEAAAYLRISERHLRTLVKHGDIPRLTYTRPSTFLQDDLVAYVRSTRARGDDPAASG